MRSKLLLCSTARGVVCLHSRLFYSRVMSVPPTLTSALGCGPIRCIAWAASAIGVIVDTAGFSRSVVEDCDWSTGGVDVTQALCTYGGDSLIGGMGFVGSVTCCTAVCSLTGC